MSNQPTMRCAFCDGAAQYIDRQTDQPLCLEHSRLEVRAFGEPENPPSGPPERRIRPASPADRGVLEAFARYFWNEVTMDCFGKAYDMLQLPSLLLCEDDEVIGCLTYSEDFEDDALTIVMLNIYPGHNGCGGGRALVAAADGIARERGIGRLRVATSNDNVVALYFYQRLGFVLAGMVLNVIHEDIREFGGIPVRDEIQLERPLAPFLQE